MRHHLEVLAADGMMGRRAGSGYERQAAGYIRARFQAYGLLPGADEYLQGFPIDRVVDGQTGLSSQNVIGVLRGAGSLAEEVVVLGAHYDHLGWITAGDSVVVFNGADDNASGTALLLELARAMSGVVRGRELKGRDRRSVVFQAFGAEEVGLVGSFYYCDHPTVPMEGIVAMLNFDMVGRFGPQGLFLMGASSSSDWRELVVGANDERLPIVYTDEALNRSDQYCFYQNETPILFFHTGLHDQYHTPRDDVALIDVDGMVAVGELAMEVLVDLIVTPSPPSYTGGTLPGVGALVDTGRAAGVRRSP
jgi:Zn-dependent M28 family amino/carboxypeptidase